MGGFFDRALLKYRQIRSGASTMPARAGLRITGAQVTDNDAEDLTEIAISGTGSTVRTLNVASSGLTTGDWVCPLASDPTQVVRATPSVAIAAGSILGCVDATYAPGATNVTIFTSGQVVAAAAFPDLGGGASGKLQLNASGRAARRQLLPGGAIRCGGIDATGNVTVDTYVPALVSPAHGFDPTTFGAALDGVTDDLDALNAMLAAMPQDSLSSNPTASAGYVIDWPAGAMAYVRDTWIVNKCVKFRAHGGQHGRFTGGLISALGHTAIRVDNGTLTATTGQYSEIAKLTLVSNPIRRRNSAGRGAGSNINGDKFNRSASTRYELGNTVVAASSANKSQYFEITGATGNQVSSSGNEASVSFTGGHTFSNAVTGDTATDGNLTWTCKAIAQPRQDGRVVRVGDRYTNTGPHKGGANDIFGIGPDDCNYCYFEVAIAGTLATGAVNRPAGLNAAGEGSVIVDGDATVVAKVHAGIIANAPCDIHDIGPIGFTNAGVHGEGNGSTSFDNASIDKIYIAAGCGLGVCVIGSDANGVWVTRVRCLGNGADLDAVSTNGDWTDYTNLGGVTAHDHSQGGVVWIGCNGQSSNGRNIFCSNSSGESLFLGCVSENGLGDRSTVNGPLHFSQSAGRLVGGFLALGTGFGNGQQLAEADYTNANGVATLNSGITKRDGITLNWWSSNNDTPSFLRWGYKSAALGSKDFGYEYYANSTGAIPSIGIAGAGSAQTAGNPRQHRGFFRGSEAGGLGFLRAPPADAAIVYQGFISALADFTVRDGKRKAGDMLEDLANVTPGTWRFPYVYTNTSDKYVGGAWLASHQYFDAAGWAPMPADQIQISGGGVTKSFKVKDGFSGTSASAAHDVDFLAAATPGVSTVSDGSVTWLYLDVAPTNGARYGFIDDPVIAMTPHARGRIADTAATDPTTAAPKAIVPWARVQQTVTSSAEATIFEIDPADATWSPLTDHATHIINTTIGIAGGADHGSIKLSGTFKRVGGAPTRIGTDDNSPKTDSGTTARYNVSGNKVQVLATLPSSASTTITAYIAIEETRE